jgi:hypothetical protein
MHTNTGVVACKHTDMSERRLRFQWKIYSFSTQNYKMHIGYTIGVLCVQKLVMGLLFMYVKLLIYVKQSFKYGRDGRDNRCKDVIPEGRMNRTQAMQYNTAIFISKYATCFYKTATCFAPLSHHQYYKTKQILKQKLLFCNKNTHVAVRYLHLYTRVAVSYLHLYTRVAVSYLHLYTRVAISFLHLHTYIHL